eukprot:2801443-Rhodomonas_salina.1
MEPGVAIVTLSIRAVPDLIRTNRLDSRILDSFLYQRHPAETLRLLGCRYPTRNGAVRGGGWGASDGSLFEEEGAVALILSAEEAGACKATAVLLHPLCAAPARLSSLLQRASPELVVRRLRLSSERMRCDAGRASAALALLVLSGRSCARDAVGKRWCEGRESASEARTGWSLAYTAESHTRNCKFICPVLSLSPTQTARAARTPTLSHEETAHESLRCSSRARDSRNALTTRSLRTL